MQLLRDVSGALRPEMLTALIGVSGAGKTPLMDVLAGRKTGGYTEGNIFISGYPKNQSTFARVSGYCEQNDIHSPNECYGWASMSRRSYNRTEEEVADSCRIVRAFAISQLGLQGVLDGLGPSPAFDILNGAMAWVSSSLIVSTFDFFDVDLQLRHLELSCRLTDTERITL
ncbi:plant PDR ABC transporter associated protein [Tanacetum coccineum]